MMSASQNNSEEGSPETGENAPPPPPPAVPPAEGPPQELVALAAGLSGQTAPMGASPYAPPVYANSPGRRYGFLCTHCSSRLEANDSLAGQSGACPTCGNAIIIPILDNRGRLIDPTSGEVIKQDPHPVHAYAAAGHRAPQIITSPDGKDMHIKCPRCQRLNPITGNNCLGCGLPFTMEGTMGDTIGGTNTWSVASLVLGIVGVPAACLGVPSILGLIFGIIAMRGMSQNAAPSSGKGMAIAGIVLSIVGLLIGGLMLLSLVLR